MREAYTFFVEMASFPSLGPLQESDGAEEQKRYHGEHQQMPRLKQIIHLDTSAIRI
jgi:hypothetical protein